MLPIRFPGQAPDSCGLNYPLRLITPQSHPNHTPMTPQSHPNHAPITPQSHPNHTPITPQSHPNHPASLHRFRVASPAYPGARLNVRTTTGATPLHKAVAEGHSHVVRELLASKADVNAVTASKGSALHLAAVQGDADVLRELLRWGADATCAPRGFTPLHLANQLGREDVASILEDWDLVLNATLARTRARRAEAANTLRIAAGEISLQLPFFPDVTPQSSRTRRCITGWTFLRRRRRGDRPRRAQRGARGGQAGEGERGGDGGCEGQAAGCSRHAIRAMPRSRRVYDGALFSTPDLEPSWHRHSTSPTTDKHRPKHHRNVYISTH